MEAIHHFDPDDRRWLARVADGAAAALGLGLGAIACQVSPSEDGRCALHVLRSSAVPHELIPPQLAAAARRRGRRGVARVALGDRERCAILIPAPPATTLRRIADRARIGTTASWTPRAVGDALVIRGTTRDGRRGLLLVAPDRRPIRLSGRRQRALDRIGAQIATACRLRTRLSGRDPFVLAARALSSFESREPEPAGDRRDLYVTGRKGTSAAAVELWLRLLSGRWCVVDHRDRDGKRLLLAVPRPAAGAAPFELGPDEREVLMRTAAREPLKCVASELGLGASTASALLRSALRKLRLDSPSEAIRIFSAGLASRGKSSRAQSH